jgi:hypothetical protein
MVKNFRIKKVTEDGETKYFPQHKFLGLFWMNMFGCEPYWDGSYSILEVAQKRMCDYLKEPVVEYLEVDCGE